MNTKGKKATSEYRTIKVKPETYKRLRMYQAKMELQSEGEETYPMDRLIGALMDFVEATEIKFQKSKGAS